VLHKEVCRKCMWENIARFEDVSEQAASLLCDKPRFDAKFEADWEERKVGCPVCWPTSVDDRLDIDAKVPSNCRYLTEQVVSQGSDE